MTSIQYISCSEACRELGVRLVSLIGDADPAPWIKTNDVPLPLRWRERANLMLQRSLLAGELTAIWLIDGQAKTIPAWAWESSESAARAFWTGELVLDPTLPPGWGQLSGRTCHVSTDQFDKWLASGWADAESPRLPPPFDVSDKPTLITIRVPNEKNYVSLAEALTWMAFGNSLDHQALLIAVECSFANFKDRDVGLEALAWALSKLGEANVVVRGRHVADYSGAIVILSAS